MNAECSVCLQDTSFPSGHIISDTALVNKSPGWSGYDSKYLIDWPRISLGTIWSWNSWRHRAKDTSVCSSNSLKSSEPNIGEIKKETAQKVEEKKDQKLTKTKEKSDKEKK